MAPLITTSFEGLGFDTARFEITERRVLGPFYKVSVTDARTGAAVPLWRGGVLLLGHGSVRRAVKFGVARYLKQNPDVLTGA